MTTKNMKAYYAIRAKKGKEKREREKQAQQPRSQASIDNAASWAKFKRENPKGYYSVMQQLD
jgi:hypothetical protein